MFYQVKNQKQFIFNSLRSQIQNRSTSPEVSSFGNDEYVSYNVQLPVNTFVASLAGKDTNPKGIKGTQVTVMAGSTVDTKTETTDSIFFQAKGSEDVYRVQETLGPSGSEMQYYLFKDEGDRGHWEEAHFLPFLDNLDS